MEPTPRDLLELCTYNLTCGSEAVGKYTLWHSSWLVGRPEQQLQPAKLSVTPSWRRAGCCPHTLPHCAHNTTLQTHGRWRKILDSKIITSKYRVIGTGTILLGPAYSSVFSDTWHSLARSPKPKLLIINISYRLLPRMRADQTVQYKYACWRSAKHQPESCTNDVVPWASKRWVRPISWRRKHTIKSI